MIIQSNNLSKRYNSVQAVDELSLNVPEGTIYGFLGRNGAGKTTTIRMLMGIIKPDNGTIKILNQEKKQIGIKEKQCIGYVSQEQFFYPWMTCRYIGTFVSGFYPNWNMDVFNQFLQDMDLPPNQKISSLSGGMRIKLALALALSYNPEILILDEPTSGLDPLSRREFLDLIKERASKNGRTIFFSSHIIDEVERVANYIGIIEKGKMSFQGSIESLKDKIRRIKIPYLRSTTDDEVDNTKISFNSYLSENGFKILQEIISDETRELIIFSETGNWDTLNLRRNNIEIPTLEDSFIALTKKRVAV